MSKVEKNPSQGSERWQKKKRAILSLLIGRKTWHFASAAVGRKEKSGERDCEARICDQA